LYQPKCTVERPEERKNGACQSIKEEVVVYIHHGAALLPILLPRCCLFRRYETCSATPYVSSWRYACLAPAWHLLGINEWFCR